MSIDGQTDGQKNLHLSRSLLEENIMYEYNLNRFYGCTNSSLPNMLLTNHFFGTALKTGHWNYGATPVILWFKTNGSL